MLKLGYFHHVSEMKMMKHKLKPPPQCTNKLHHLSVKHMLFNHVSMSVARWLKGNFCNFCRSGNINWWSLYDVNFFEKNYPPGNERRRSPWNWMVGRWVSLWEFPIFGGYASLCSFWEDILCPHRPATAKYDHFLLSDYNILQPYFWAAFSNLAVIQIYCHTFTSSQRNLGLSLAVW